ncbi:MAG: hypothetical protein A2521_04520 [Deltaproteobacteria bacterium RIFOXYD12_FULL_57_12]|nr:MAG: hypothetical protein A2521_04520 [Deltaproteobacteria bacterium RIFOXYD12_FULL_57_12]
MQLSTNFLKVHRILATLFFVILVARPAAVFSLDTGQLTPEQVAEKLQKSYVSTTSMSANFKQVTAVSMSSRQRQGTGTVVLLKPGRMRWDYFTPERQILISDGQTIRMYFEKNKQMIVSAAKEYLQSDVTYSFFAGTGEIQRDFNITAPDKENVTDDSSYLIKLIPKNAHPQLDHLYLWVDRHSFLIKRLQLIDHFNTITELFFENIRTTTEQDKIEIKPDVFNFTPPPDTEVVIQ